MKARAQTSNVDHLPVFSVAEVEKIKDDAITSERSKLAPLIAAKSDLALSPNGGTASENTIQAYYEATIAEIRVEHALALQKLEAEGATKIVEAAASAVGAERQRWATVMQSDAARGRENLAITLLAQPSLPADAVLAALDAAPDPAARNPFADFMAATNVYLPSPQTSAGPVNSREAREAEIASRPKIKVS